MNQAKITVKRFYDESPVSAPYSQLKPTYLPELTFNIEIQHQYSPKSVDFLKCLLLLSVLPPEALGEAVQELESIREFYSNRSSEFLQASLPQKVVKSKVISTQIRPPLALDFD